ncbi:hypothetical protein OEZ86_002060 [Tetradesmus obliquus]|nr:hypothetical protein OEZ86_002060 [Tetradesmus obliquus]
MFDLGARLSCTLSAGADAQVSSRKHWQSTLGWCPCTASGGVVASLVEASAAAPGHMLAADAAAARRLLPRARSGGRRPVRPVCGAGPPGWRPPSSRQ